MVDATGAVPTLPTVQSTWMNVSNTTQCHQVESWFYLFFVVFQTLVFLVSFSYRFSVSGDTNHIFS